MKKILIAEDDPFILDLAEAKLIQSGYEVLKTADGSSVISMMLEHKPDLLLLDLMLPNTHGFEVLTQMRTMPELSQVPVVIFSNENGEDVENKASHLNASYFFKAMTGTGELLAKVEEILQ